MHEGSGKRPDKMAFLYTRMVLVLRKTYDNWLVVTGAKFNQKYPSSISQRCCTSLCNTCSQYADIPSHVPVRCRLDSRLDNMIGALEEGNL
jgi:hypothetical protein